MVKQNKKVLVIEDMAPVRDLLNKVLSSEGYTVRACEDGLRALNAASRDVFHAVITDYRLPHMNGVDVTRHLRAKLPESVIIGVSIADKGDDFLAAGANVFLLKPYAYDEILAIISRA